MKESPISTSVSENLEKEKISESRENDHYHYNLCIINSEFL